MSSYTKEHLENALTWVERHVHDGIRIVAGALSATYPEGDSPPAPTVTLENVASVKAGEINAQFPGAEAIVLVIMSGEDLIRAGASLPDSSTKRVKEILSRALELLNSQEEAG